MIIFLQIRVIDFQKPFSCTFNGFVYSFVANLVEIQRVFFPTLRTDINDVINNFLRSGDPKTDSSNKFSRNRLTVECERLRLQMCTVIYKHFHYSGSEWHFNSCAEEEWRRATRKKWVPDMVGTSAAPNPHTWVLGMVTQRAGEATQGLACPLYRALHILQLCPTLYRLENLWQIHAGMTDITVPPCDRASTHSLVVTDSLFTACPIDFLHHKYK